MKITFISLTLIALFFGCQPKQVAEENTPQAPNVLFIAIDDLNDWVACLNGHPQVKTPNIDRLAARGMLFTNAHVQSPICNPSRTSILTGLRPSTTGVYGLSPWIRNVDELKNLETLPQTFSKNGYKTFSAGKIFHGGNGRQATDNEFDSLGPGAKITQWPDEKLAGDTPGGNHKLMDWGFFPHNDADKTDYKIADWTAGILKSEHKQPFFLSAGFFLPHVPLYITEKWWGMYPEEDLQLPPMLANDRDDTPRFSWFNHWDVPEPRLKWLEESGQLVPLVRSYLASISFVDQQVGRIIDALENSAFADNTIIVLWSDHGYHLGEKQISGKNTLWERSTRVPLIFAGPQIPEGIRYDDPVELLDIYPTLNALCSFDNMPSLEGHSLKPQIDDPDMKRTFPAVTTNNYNNHAVRTNQWRYIRYANGSEELYDMVKDPNEWENLAQNSNHQAIIDSLKQWLPQENKLPLFGNGLRVLRYENGQANWEGEDIGDNDPIPGI